MASELPTETWLAIFERLDKATWLHLNLVSKAFNASCLPLIYRNVDLSTHHSGVLHPLSGGVPEVEDPYNLILEKQARLHKVQARFLDTLLQHRDYADLIGSLTWTLTFGPEPAIPDESFEQIEYPHNQTWAVFSALSKARRVDFASEHLSMRESYARNSPEGLFPSAHSIRLSGVMGQSLVTSIVGHDYGRIQDLTIDDVQHWGLHADGKPLTDAGGSLKSQRDNDRGMYPLGPCGKCLALRSNIAGSNSYSFAR